jgi:DNA-binding SARP family transcriptional activator
MQVRFANRCEIQFPTHKSKTLFAQLVVRMQRTLPRVRLAEDFWPHSDEEHGRRALNTEVWRLRRGLEMAGCDPDDYLYADRDCLGFRPESQHWCDVSIFDDCLRGLGRTDPRCATPDFVRTVRSGAALYCGDLMDGFLDEWCVKERESYRSRWVAALEFLLLACIDEQRWREAIDYAHQLLASDPLLEHIHRSLMRCHAIIGNRPAALKQYARLAVVLREELQVEPMDETRRLYEAIVADGMAGSTSSCLAAPIGTSGNAISPVFA